jgi:hypothetical protein
MVSITKKECPMQCTHEDALIVSLITDDAVVIATTWRSSITIGLLSRPVSIMVVSWVGCRKYVIEASVDIPVHALILHRSEGKVHATKHRLEMVH